MGTSRQLLISLLLLLSLAIANADDYYEDEKRGWYWRELPPVEEEPEEPVDQDIGVVIDAQSVEPAEPLSPREILKKQGEEWEDAMALAILEPSDENYTEYLRRTDEIQAQSQRFAIGFKQSLWSNPEYDYTIEAPVAPQAIVAKSETDNRVRDEILADHANSKGLIFFFHADCAYCDRFAPVLKLIETQYNFSTIAVSLDGSQINEYPNASADGELGDRLGVTHVPAVYMVDPDKNTVSSVAFGYNSYSDLQDKIVYAGEMINKEATQ